MDGALVPALGVFVAVYLLTGVTLSQAVPAAAGVSVDLGLAGIISSIIAGAVTLAGLWIANKRSDPAVDQLLAALDVEQKRRVVLELKVADLEEQLAARVNPPHHRRRRVDEED